MSDLWNTMDSAPKDGTVIDVWCVCDTLPGGGFRIPDVIWEDRYGAFFSNEAGTLASDISHWMYSPSPPEAS